MATSAEVDGLARVRADLGDDGLEPLGGDRRVDRQDDERVARVVTADLHPADVHLGLAEHAADDADDAGAIVVAQEGHVLADRDVDVEGVHLNHLGGVAGTGDGAGHAHLGAVGLREGDPQQRAMVLARAVAGQRDLNAALLGQNWSVDERNGIVNEHLEDALERRQFEHAHIVLGDLAQCLDVYAKEPCTDSPLFTLETVVATPHLGASTDEAQEKAGIAVARSVRLALNGELVPDAVNVQGGQLDEVIKPMLPLAEQIGSLACGLADSAVVRIDVEALGEIADHDVRVLELSALKGVFQMLVHDPVSFVNAPVLAEQRGVEVALTTDRTSEDHRSLLRVTLTQTDGSKVSVAGTVTGARDTAKVVEVDSFDVDVPVSQHMAFFRYHDRPGIVGVVGRVLGEAGVNIGGMQVSRDDSSHALIVLTVDSAIPADRLDAIVAEIGAHSGKAVDLR